MSSILKSNINKHSQIPNMGESDMSGLPQGGDTQTAPSGGDAMAQGGGGDVLGQPTGGITPLQKSPVSSGSSMVDKLIAWVKGEPGWSYEERVSTLKTQLGPLANQVKETPDGVYIDGQMVIKRPVIPDGAVSKDTVQQASAPASPAGGNPNNGGQGVAAQVGMPMAASNKEFDSVYEMFKHIVEKDLGDFDMFDQISNDIADVEEKDVSADSYNEGNNGDVTIKKIPGKEVVLETSKIMIPDNDSVTEEGFGVTSKFKPSKLQSSVESLMGLKNSYVTKDMAGAPPAPFPKRTEVPPGPKERQAEKPPTPQPYWGKDQETKLSVGNSKVEKSPENKAQPLWSSEEKREWMEKRRPIMERVAQIGDFGDMDAFLSGKPSKSSSDSFLESLPIASKLLRRLKGHALMYTSSMNPNDKINFVEFKRYLLDSILSEVSQNIDEIHDEATKSGVDFDDLLDSLFKWLSDNIRNFITPRDDRFKPHDRTNPKNVAMYPMEITKRNSA